MIFLGRHVFRLLSVRAHLIAAFNSIAYLVLKADLEGHLSGYSVHVELLLDLVANSPLLSTKKVLILPLSVSKIHPIESVRSLKILISLVPVISFIQASQVETLMTSELFVSTRLVNRTYQNKIKLYGH